MALTRVYGRVVYPHGEGTPTPVTGDGVIEYVHAAPGIVDGAVHGPDRKRAEYVAGVAEDAWLKPGMWRAYVYPDQGRSYTLHLGVPETGETTIADAVGEIVPDGIITKGEPGPPGEPGRDGQDGADGADGHTPDITFDGTTIVVDGVPGPDLKGDPGEGGGGIAGAVPIFETLAEAQAWEAANPGRVALVLGDPGEDPVDPEEPGGPDDFTHQYLGADATAFNWPDARGGLTLAKAGAASVTREGDSVHFPGSAWYGPTAMPFSGEPTITVVLRTLGTSYGFVAGQPIDNGITAPGGGGHYSVKNATPHGVPGPSGEWQILTARWGTPGVTPRAITVNSTTRTESRTEQPPTSMNFHIGGMFQTGGYTFVGDVKEVRVYDRRLEDEEVFELHSALASKYGITL